MVAPFLAQQFCQMQRLGREHQKDPTSVSPEVLAAPVSTPLVTDAWAAALQLHPTWERVDCLITGMQEGFCIS